jgi:hypothetical protein
MQVCKKLYELPSVATDWQQTTWCPDCKYYDCGTCNDPTRTGDNTVCPFDGKAMPLRELTVDPSNNESQELLEDAAGTELERHSRCAELEQAIHRRIVQRTGKRIQGLEVEVTEDRVIVHGSVACYHHKQLALQGVFDVLGSGAALGIELRVQVIEGSLLTR